MICLKCFCEQVRYRKYRCKNCHDIQKRAYRNLPERKAKRKVWEARSKDKLVAAKKKWQDHNKAILPALKRKNYAVRVAEGRQKKYQTDPLIRREAKNRYKARKLNAVSEKYSAKEIFEKFNWNCTYCGDRATALDHVIPLSRSGSDTVDNLVAACRSCNSSKGAKLLSEWKSNDD